MGRDGGELPFDGLPIVFRLPRETRASTPVLPRSAVVKFEEIDREATPLGTLTLYHYEAGDEHGFEVRLDDAFLMATHGALGEEAMVRLARERAARAERILVGGLGAGHTLRAVLRELPGARVVVVEIGSKVVEWNRVHFDPTLGPSVDDARVDVRVEDLADHLRSLPSRGRYDVILVDVDNGPGWRASPANAWIYTPEGLRTASAALREGGVVAIWSPDPNPRLARALDEVFAEHQVVASRELGDVPDEPGRACPTDVVYLARAGRCVSSIPVPPCAS